MVFGSVGIFSQVEKELLMLLRSVVGSSLDSGSGTDQVGGHTRTDGLETDCFDWTDCSDWTDCFGYLCLGSIECCPQDFCLNHQETGRETLNLSLLNLENQGTFVGSNLGTLCPGTSCLDIPCTVSLNPGSSCCPGCTSELGTES